MAINHAQPRWTSGLESFHFYFCTIRYEDIDRITTDTRRQHIVYSSGGTIPFSYFRRLPLSILKPSQDKTSSASFRTPLLQALLVPLTLLVYFFTTLCLSTLEYSNTCRA